MTDRVLITGAAGRIGSLLMRELPAFGYQVRGVDRTAADGVIEADITDLAAMTKAAEGCTSVVHLAGTPNANPGWSAVNDLNIHGTRTVLEAARLAGAEQVIYASSIHTVGALPFDTPFAPDLPSIPSGIYGVSKIAGEALCQVYAAKAALQTTSIRICSFRPEPGNIRELRTWISYSDTVHLVERCLHERTPGYRMVWGLSNNTRAQVDDPTARDIGYTPQHDAEAYTLANGGTIDGSLPEEWSLMGGPVADATAPDFSDG